MLTLHVILRGTSIAGCIQDGAQVLYTIEHVKHPLSSDLRHPVFYCVKCGVIFCVLFIFEVYLRIL